jgi:hypothetical protein
MVYDLAGLVVFDPDGRLWIAVASPFDVTGNDVLRSLQPWPMIPPIAHQGKPLRIGATNRSAALPVADVEKSLAFASSNPTGNAVNVVPLRT